eukprot:TRINITY_DN100794_c0_g1_i1.p1 TRINITY_DN100794_c0_g1~~TRINITY_DN100794_c0_g1_i1.p1  ORF type:complete len:251 (+),score=26.52 TRINITY_DN100794_c0_g1_i1:83-754(+)
MLGAIVRLLLLLQSAQAACNEELSGDKGAGYRGCQDTTVRGFTCQRWDAQVPHTHTMKINDTSLDLKDNLCRNPDGEPSIWCYTTDENTRWDVCKPSCELVADEAACKAVVSVSAINDYNVTGTNFCEWDGAKCKTACVDDDAGVLVAAALLKMDVIKTCKDAKFLCTVPSMKVAMEGTCPITCGFCDAKEIGPPEDEGSDTSSSDDVHAAWLFFAGALHLLF